MDRFMEKVVFEPNTGCWLWDGTIKNNGYGLFVTRSNGRSICHHAHRFAYKTLVGAIPEGLELDHLCHTRSCVNPSHLEPVTRSVNNLRGDLPKLKRAARDARTHCRRGHELTPENTVLNTKGVRQCRECCLMAKRRYRGQEVPPVFMMDMRKVKGVSRG